MVTSDEKLDDLMVTVHKIDKDLEVYKVKSEKDIEAIKCTLQSRADALKNIYDFMQRTDQRLLKIETNKEDEAVVRSWFAPYVIAVFSSLVSYIFFHFWGK